MSKLRAVLRRRWSLILTTTVIGILAGAVTAQLSKSEVEQVYTASQVILYHGGSSSLAQDELKVTRGEIPERAAEIYGEPGRGQQLAARIGTNLNQDSSSISISSSSTNPEEAAKLVQAFTSAFLEVKNQAMQADARAALEETQAELEAATNRLAAFDKAYPEASQPGVFLSVDPAVKELVQQRESLKSDVDNLAQRAKEGEQTLAQSGAYESLGPERPRPASSGLVSVPTSPLTRAGLLGAFGLLLGGAVSMLIERINRRIDTREELVEAVNLPIIAEIGYLKEKDREHEADGSLLLRGIWAEPYRGVRSAIQFVQNQPSADRTMLSGGSPGAVAAGEPPQVFLVTSASPGEGKSTTVALTGEALGEVGVPTLVVGADFRRPEVDRLLGVERSPSLQDMARMDVNRLDVDDIVQKARFPSLYVAAAGRGTREVTGLIDAAKEVIQEARSRGATVLVDSSPLLAANDTIDLLPVVDYVILVVRSGVTTESRLTEIIETLQRLDAKILGVVLIATPAAGRQQYYYYDYYAPSDKPTPARDQGQGLGAEPVTVVEPVVDVVAPSAVQAPLSRPSAPPPVPPRVSPAAPPPLSSPPPSPGSSPAPVPKPNGTHPPGPPPPSFDQQESLSHVGRTEH